MIIINSVSNTLFSFNGIEYFRNYISVVRGERIEIFNCYERDDVMLPLSHYSEVSLNGITYSNATDLQSVLQTVIYSRATLGSDEVEVIEQNNVGKVIYLDYVSGSDLLTQVLGDINSQTTLISATDNPVFFTAYKSASTASVAQKLRFQFMGGKGTWGAGGSAVLPSHLYQLPPESLLPEDITANSKSNVISLGQVTNEPEFLTKANSAVRDLTDTSKLHYFSYSLDSVLYLKRFTGQPGEYDGTQTVLTETDFNEATNSNVQPGLYLPTLKDITAVDSFTDTPITVTDNNTGDNITFSGSSIKHTSVNGETTTLDYQPNTEDVTYSIPAKSTDDVFAMQSDVNGITIVSNQSASELYLKNVDGTTLATINLGFLNNEGTTFFYNETSEKLELKNDDGEVLSEVPVSAFVANLMQSVNFNGSTPQTLEFKDAEGNVVDSVTFTISNIQGLQGLLDAKVSYTDMDSTPVLLSEKGVKSNGVYTMIRRHVISTETDLDNYNEAGYFLTPNGSLTNLPNGFPQTRYALTVNAANAVYGSQILICCGFDGFIAIRRRSGNEWGKWICFTDSKIGDAEDLNNYINTGVFTQTQNSQAVLGSNYPAPYAGMLTVHQNSGIVWQTYLCYSETNNLYHRGRNSSGTWSNWVKEWDSSDFSQADIDNWNTAFGWGDFKDYGLGTDCKISSNWDNITQSGFYRNGDSSTVGIPLAVGSIAMLHMEVNGNAVQMAFRSGGSNYYIRRRTTSTWSSWDSVLTSSNISTSDTTNWNTAFGWGNHTGQYLPLGADIPTDTDLDTYLQTGIFIQRFNFQAAAGTNYPVPLKGFLEVLRTPEGLISQKYHVTGGDENNYYIRIFGNSWSSWKKLLSNVDITDSNIANWNTAFNRGDFKDYGLGESILPVTDLTSSNANVNRFFRFLSTANGSGGFAGGAISMKYDNAPSTAFLGANGNYAFVGYKPGANETPQFYKLWDTRNFSQTDVNNWNTAFGWGNHNGKYLPLGGSIPNSVDLNNYITNGVYIQILNSQAENGVNYPVPLSGSLEVYSIGSGAGLRIFQKYHVYGVNNDLYIRSNTGGNWSPWVKVLDSLDVTSENISNWNNALLKSGGTMTGAIKYGNPTQNQTSFIGTQLAGTEIGYTAWMLQNLDYDSSNQKFTKPRASLLSLALALGTGDKALRLMYAPNAVSNGDDADLSTVFSVDSQGRIVTSEHGTSAQWNEAYNRGDFRDFGLGATALISNDWDSINQTGFYYNDSAYATGTPLNVANISLQHIEQAVSAVQFAFRTGEDGVWIRRRVTTAWSTWANIWTSQDFTQSNINTWNIVKVSADYTNPTSSVGYGGGDSINDLPKGTYTAILSTNISDQPFTSVGGFISIGATGVGQGTQILGSRTGNELWFRPYSNTYGSWYRLWNSGDFTSTNVSNWNAAFDWGSHVGKYVGFAGNTGYATLFNGDINDLPVGNIVHAISGSATNQPTDIGTPRSLFTFGARSGSDTPLASDLVIGISGMSFRNRTNDIWRRVWTDSDFSQSNIDNWNTAYNRGDFRDYGLGRIGVASYPTTDLNDTTVANGFYSVPNNIANVPINSSGTLIIERYSSGSLYITQKYQAVNTGDVVRMFIRHYKTGAASWTPWREIWTDENFSPDDKAEVNDTLSFKGIIPSNDDINSYTLNGFYSTESSTTANLPVEDKGILTVASNGNDHSQTYTNYNSNEFYFRTSNPSGGAWNSWERMAKSSERVINDTLTTPPSAASLNALYPSAKPTFTVIAPNVEKGNMYVKTNDGWLVFAGNTVA